MTRPAGQQDFDFIYNLYMHPAVNPFLLYEKMDRSSFEPIFNELLGLIYVFEDSGESFGMFKFIPLKHRNAHIAYLGGLAIDPSKSEKGYGLKMMHEIIQLGKSMNLLRIELSTATSNKKAIRLYEKAGFQQEGILRKYTYLRLENRFVDEVMMGYLY